ncbi:Rsp5p-dependent ubiquitination, sorting of cargo proteins at the multivesicular body [Meristemomyces frigidus]|uniref:Protein SSH4 n=1 Tax=Meristemomyces frigidus TaxID=1508187 RepID=A0AAN7YPJ1_9PEZI|nr:Rsp5p-dependent ubiquitination, sorting of cargo proteins at the multivesicular body [Meristemomyces frigidus]
MNHDSRATTLSTIYGGPQSTQIPGNDATVHDGWAAWPQKGAGWESGSEQRSWLSRTEELGSTGKGILIGMLSAFGSAALVALIIAIVYFFRSDRGRILLDRISRPGEFDDEQQFLREEEEALAEMDDLQRAEYHRAKAFVQVNPPESQQTDISLSQFLAIQEKGVSAWEFEPELETASAFVESRTEIEFFDATCSVQSNLPIPKQNEVYYWEAKLYEKPDDMTTVSIGLTTKPYPLFRLPGLHRCSIGYFSDGKRRFNQPFGGSNYGPAFVQGDVVGIGYRPRTGTVFFTRNGKKLDDVAHGLKLQNFFPTVGANGPCRVHVNFGQMGFVFIEANVKKWGLAPMTGSLAPPPPYGSEAGSILLEGGREGVREGQGFLPGHGRTNSAQVRLQGRMTRSPGPVRSPTDISLAQLNLMDSRIEELGDDDEHEDIGEGRSRDGPYADETPPAMEDDRQGRGDQGFIDPGLPLEAHDHPPPKYESPEGSINLHREEGSQDEHEHDDEDDDEDRNGRNTSAPSDAQPLLPARSRRRNAPDSPPIPSYEAATSAPGPSGGRGRSERREEDE